MIFMISSVDGSSFRRSSLDLGGGLIVLLF